MWTVLAVIIFIILIARVIYYYVIIQPVKYEHPSAGNNTRQRQYDDYHNEYYVLDNFISGIKGKDGLAFAKYRVAMFRKKYKNKIDWRTLNDDVKELNRHIGLQQIIIKERPTTLN